jgi:truncated hemoglobin YjbI
MISFDAAHAAVHYAPDRRFRVWIRPSFRLTEDHFERWLQLWRETVVALCSDELASLFNRKARMIGGRLLHTISTYHQSAVREAAEATRGAL